jgi:NAD(P)H-flavin reductase
MKGEKQSLVCRLIRKRGIISDITRLDFEWSGTPPKAGQFFLVKPARSSVFLARPLGAAVYDENKIGFLAAVRGKGTAELAAMYEGEEALITGPLGNTWSDFIPEDNQDNIKKPLALISGGLGLAPVAALSMELLRRSFTNFDFFAGFRREGEKMIASLETEEKIDNAVIINEEEYTEKHKDTPSGGRSAKRGLVTDFLNAENYSAVFACGPAPMLRAAAAKCRNAGTPCFVSLEARMACGTGACLGCSLPSRGGAFKHCCSDGPVFNAEEVFFDEFFDGFNGI